MATGHPPGNSAIVSLSADLWDVPIICAWTPPDLVRGLSGVAIDQLADFDCADYVSDSYQDLARRFLAFSDQTFMEDDAVAGFGIVTMVADAAAAVGDDPVAIAEYLHDQTYELEGYPFTMGWTEWGEMSQAQPIFTLVTPGRPPKASTKPATGTSTVLQSETLEPYDPGHRR